MKGRTWGILALLPALGACSLPSLPNPYKIVDVATSSTIRTVYDIATSDSAKAAAKALLQRKQESYQKNPLQLLSDVQTVQRDFRNLMQLLRGKAGKTWGENHPRLPDQTHYVKYTQGYLSRAIVDFDRGEITVETLDDRHPERSLREALITTLLTPDDPRAVDLFSDRAIRLDGQRPPYLQGLVLDELGRAITTPQQAERYADNIVGLALKRSVPTDAGIRQVHYVRFNLVSHFSDRQAEKYRPLAERYARAYGVSTSLVLAIMRTESHFNPYAVSSAPAYGLMQLVPTSGGRDAYRRATGEDRIPEPAYLFDPENNIELGAAYLSVLAENQLDGILDPVSKEYCVISAYNTGAGNVLRTFRGGTRRDAALQRINGMSAPAVYAWLRKELPYEETRAYLQKVVEARRLYIALN